MTKRELIDYCLTYPAAFEDYPFDETAAVMKHSGNKKMFALISYKDGRLYINLKCEPFRADFLRGVFESVTPGWHMNKVHWNTVYINGDVPWDKVCEMIQHSYDMVKPKTTKREKQNMQKKLRKMLGDVNSPSAAALRELIDTQSKDTIRKWCLGYARDKILPIFENHCPGDDRPRNAVNAAYEYLDGKVKFPIVKNIILNECHAAARELGDNPAAQAAARAVGQGSAVVHTLTHSLGLYFYAAAAVAYDRVGLYSSVEIYADIAEEVCLDYTEALRAVAVEDEPNPAKLKWNC